MKTRPLNPIFAAAFIACLAASSLARAGDGGIYIGPDPRVPGWQRADPEKWSPNKAATAIELITPLLAGSLEMLDGSPDVKMHIWTTGETFRAAIKAINLPDDAILGEETVIAVKEGTSGWSVTEIWKRWQCRRGPNSRKWGIKICP